MRLLKYIVLILIVVLTWATTTLVFRPYDPWVAFMHISRGEEILKEFPFAVLILAIVLIGSFLVDRFWCKYLCPLGAFMNIFNKFSLFKVHRDKNSCIGCGKCNRNCQMNIDIKGSENITDLECINCLKCSSVCHVNDTIKTKASWFKGEKYINSMAFVIITLLIFSSVYFTSKVTNTWNAKGKMPVSSSVENIDVSAIKGYMTLEEIAKYMHMDKKELYKNIGIPDSVPENTILKEVSKYVDGFTLDGAKEKLKK